jgi:hypothetical protein
LIHHVAGELDRGKFWILKSGQSQTRALDAQWEGCMRECTDGGAFAENHYHHILWICHEARQRACVDRRQCATRISRGELHHVWHGSELISIRSGETGIDLREET